MAWDRTKGTPEPIRLLNRVKERENGEPLVSILEVAPKVKILRPQVIPYVRETIAKMCQEAAERLPENMYLGLVEGWRPLERQQRIYDHFWQCALEAFPDRSFSSLRRTVCRYIAPTDQKAPPGHCTGAAVDVHLVNDQNEPYDVSSPLTGFGAAATYALGLSETALKNRSILVETMLSVGFSNCRDEWWHYSWGDAGWAVRTNQDSCPYGLISLERSLYFHLEKEHEETTKARQNPFLPSA